MENSISLASQSMAGYNSLSNFASSLDHTAQGSPSSFEGRLEMKNDDMDNELNGFFSSGDLNLTLKRRERSWIDPWEISPSDTYYNKKNISPTKKNVAKSIFDNNKFDEDHYKLDLKRRKSTFHPAKKFGPWDGVMAGCLLNIFGVIMFLRVGWIIGQCGILYCLVIIGLSSIITLLTTLSMSAICTNGTIKAGGAYYIISRTLGPAFGGSVGFLLSFGNMIAVALYLIGFCETLVDNLQSDANFSITGNYVNDVRIWANILLIFVLILAVVGLKYVIKMQISLLVFICFAIFTLILGSFYQTKDNALYGYKGWSNGNFVDNLSADYTENWNFWTVLAIFFPAVTGIMAGANISGDLRNPSLDIPKGTLAAIAVSSTVYMLLAMIVGAVTSRTELLSNTLVMADICVWDYIVLLGIYAATLSSAIASLVGAPRILMAIANDNIIRIPGLSFFAKTDQYGNPIRGYFLSFSIAFCFNCVGELNLIAPLISQFFIIVYLLINFSCFIMEISRCPGWRPGFKYFNKYSSLLGSLLCISVMFLLDHWYATGTLAIAFALYLLITWSDPICSWGGSFYSYSVYKVYRNLLGLALDDNKQNSQMVWRPSFLLVTFGDVSSSLISFIETLRKDHSLIFCIKILVGDYRSNLTYKYNENRREQRGQRSIMGYLPIKQYQQRRTKLKGKRVLGFNNIITSDSYRNGFQSTLQLCGLGVLRPNTLIIKLLDDEDRLDIDEYVDCVRDALLSELGVIICCGFYEKINFSFDKFATNNNNKILDVWWMADDGGLTILLPYIMILCTFWNKLIVRINIVTQDKEEETFCNYESQKIKNLIKKFRLPYNSTPRIIRVNKNKPNMETINKFENYAKCKLADTIRKNVISRWLRLSELIKENSNDSALIIVTLPVPSKFIEPKQYISILNVLSDQNILEQPMILMRGNGKQILTFDSE